MKKRLNILCIIIFVVLAAQVIGTTQLAFTGLSVGFKAGYFDAEEDEDQVYDFYSVKVYPEVMNDRTAATLTDYKTKRQYKVWPSTMIVKGGCEIAPPAILTMGACGLATIVATVIGLLAFIKFVRNINRNEIFSSSTIGHLRRLGWCFVVSSVALTSGHVIEAVYLQKTFSLSGYAINHEDFVSFEGLLFAIFTFIIAEAFAIAKKMKEEQELTI